MTHTHRKRGFNPQVTMPDGLTDTLQAKIQSLRPSVKADYLKTECFSKFVSDDTDPAVTRRTRAINKWLATERENEATNDRLIFTPDSYLLADRVPFGRFVSFCRDIIIGIIGETVPIEALVGSFSGGASTSRNRACSFPASKYLGKAHVTQRALDLFLDVVDEMPGWLNARNELLVEVVPGNVLFTVPKKTDIDRCACKEPDINMFLQKGVGDYFRSSLRSVGINLNDQRVNQSLAREGSVTNGLATLDLSSASDSISSGLVALLLPECWHSVLDSLRSPVTIIDGEEHPNHMFSSMGNGFTFELESLLFYALARTTAYFAGARGVISVYGDDIIVPTAMSEALIDVLDFFGFSVNTEKTFISGPFRESCGGHYSDGYDITPFYVKGPLRLLSDVIDVANKLRRWAEIPMLGVLDPEVEDIWLWLKSHVPEQLWGGADLSFKYQLVSDDVPALRLQEEMKVKGTGNGGYLHWLNASWARTDVHVGISTSSHSTSLNRVRVRPVRDQVKPRLPCLFLHEIKHDAEYVGE